MKIFLTIKPPCTQSQTETSTENQNSLKATASLAAVETAEHDTEAVSHKTRDAKRLEKNNSKNIFTYNSYKKKC